MLQPGWSIVDARLTSDNGTIAERLVDYTTRFAETTDAFANAPIDVVATACTGASYLIGLDAELQLTEEVETRRQVPFLTAALASVAMLRIMGAKRVALLTPYPENPNRQCIPYWQSHGFEITHHLGPALRDETFHPIYSLAGDTVLESYRTLARSGGRRHSDAGHRHGDAAGPCWSDIGRACHPPYPAPWPWPGLRYKGDRGISSAMAAWRNGSTQAPGKNGRMPVSAGRRETG